MNITDALHDFFKARPAVTVSGLAVDSGVYRTTIHRSMNGERILPESERRLREAMRKYGYGKPTLPEYLRSKLDAHDAEWTAIPFVATDTVRVWMEQYEAM